MFKLLSQEVIAEKRLMRFARLIDIMLAGNNKRLKGDDLDE